MPSHWTYQAALRALDALMRFGGSGTTLDMHTVTGRMSPRDDVHALRMMLRDDFGYSWHDALDAVASEDLGLHNDSQVFRYTLRDDVRQLHRDLRAIRRDHDLKPHLAVRLLLRRRGEGRRPKSSTLPPSAPSPSPALAGRVGQTRLFETAPQFKDQRQ